MSALAAKKATPEAKVILVEKSGHPGGMHASGYPILGFLDKKHRKIVGGLSDGFINRVTDMGGSKGIRTDPHHLSICAVTPDIVKVVVGDMLTEAGEDILLHSELSDAKVADKFGVFVCAGNKFEVSASYFIDSAGDGALAYLCGAWGINGELKCKIPYK